MDASGSWFLKSGSGSGSAKKPYLSVYGSETLPFLSYGIVQVGILNQTSFIQQANIEVKLKVNTKHMLSIHTTVLQTICGICMCGMVPSRNYGMHMQLAKAVISIRTLQQMLIVWQSVGIITVRYVRYLLSYWLLRVLNCHGTRSVETIQYACSQAFFLLYT